MEAPFDADGRHFNRGTFLVRNVPATTLDAAAKELGLKAYGLASAPAGAVHPVRAARVAILHTWVSTQTEGWWRIALDELHVPYDYISPQDIAAAQDLRARWDVILFPPGGGTALSLIEGLPMWGPDPVPWKASPETPNLGTLAQTDDIRRGMTWQGLIALQNFVKAGGVFVAATSSTELPITYGFTRGIAVNPIPAETTVRNSLLRTRLVDETSPLAYGLRDNLAVFTNDGQSFSVSLDGGGRGRSGAGGAPPVRTTGTGRPDDPDVIQGRPVYQPHLPSDGAAQDRVRGGLPPMPPGSRPRTILRFASASQLLVSGLLNGGGDIADRANLVQMPFEKGQVVLFSFNPMYRGGTEGTYPFVLNAILHFDSLGAGRGTAR